MILTFYKQGRAASHPSTVHVQSAQQPDLRQKNEIGRDWYRSQTGRDFRGKSENMYSCISPVDDFLNPKP